MRPTMDFCSSIGLAMPSPSLRSRSPFLFVMLAMLLFLLFNASSSYADSATWKMNPATRDWNHAPNWTPMTIPNGPLDIATFAFSNKTEQFRYYRELHLS